MKKKHLLILVVLTLCFVTVSNAQRRRKKGTVDIVNGFAIGGGITKYDILTDNFNFITTDGWLIGMSATVELPHKWFNVSYGMQLSENKLALALQPSTLNNETQVDYKMFTAQVAFLWHIKLASEFLTFDVGPMLQYNSDFEFDNKDLKTVLLRDFTDISAEEVTDLSNFNANAAVGLTAGISHFKIRAQYIYGFTNILGALNKANVSNKVDRKFKGNQSMLALTAMISF